MIVELVGLPGTGKSTLARRLADDGRFTLITVRGTKEILWRNLCSLIVHPIRWTRLLILTLRNLGPRTLWYEKFVNLFLVANAKYHKARSCEYALIDQGYFQNYLSLYESSQSREEYLSPLASIAQSDVVIFFDIPERERQARLSKRGYGTRERMGAEYRLRFEKAMQTGAAFLRTLFAESLRINEGEIPCALVSVSSDERFETLRATFNDRRHLIYILNSRMPTEKAHGNQVAKMCEEFGKLGALVELWYPNVTANPLRGKSIFGYYGVAEEFFPIPIESGQSLALRRWLPKLGFYLVGVRYLLTLLRRHIPKDAWCYVRKAEVVWLLKRKGARVVFECHEWFQHFAWIQMMLLRRADMIVTTNRYIKQKFIERGFPESKVVVAPNGVDLSVFAIDLTKEEAVKKLGLDGAVPGILKKRVLMYTGKLTTMGEDKGVEDILQALVLLRDANVVFLSVGGSAEENEKYRKRAWELGIEDLTYFIEHQPKERLALFQRAADVLLMPFPKKAHFEYFMSPLKTFEYMASGRPIVASDLPSIREVLDDDTAFFSMPGEPRSLAETIGVALERGVDAKEKAGRARAKAKNHAWSARASRLLDMIYPI